jgi:hypothetical protein
MRGIGGGEHPETPRSAYGGGAVGPRRRLGRVLEPAGMAAGTIHVPALRDQAAPQGGPKPARGNMKFRQDASRRDVVGRKLVTMVTTFPNLGRLHFAEDQSMIFTEVFGVFP